MRRGKFQKRLCGRKKVGNIFLRELKTNGSAIQHILKGTPKGTPIKILSIKKGLAF
jgi:hypothetical protein